MESATSGALSTEQPLSGRLSVELSEENTSRLARLVSAVPVQDVELEEDEVVMRMSLGFNRRPRTAAGYPPQNGALVFDPQQIEGAPAFAPTEQLLDLTRFAYPVSGPMYGAKVSGVDVQKDRLILSGEVRKIPLGGSRPVDNVCLCCYLLPVESLEGVSDNMSRRPRPMKHPADHIWRGNDPIR